MSISRGPNAEVRAKQDIGGTGRNSKRGYRKCTGAKRWCGPLFLPPETPGRDDFSDSHGSACAVKSRVATFRHERRALPASDPSGLSPARPNQWYLSTSYRYACRQPLCLGESICWMTLDRLLHVLYSWNEGSFQMKSRLYDEQ